MQMGNLCRPVRIISWQTVAVGDMLVIGNELAQIVAKHSAAFWDAKRGVLATSGGSSYPRAHSVGDQFTMMCEAVNSISTYEGGYAFWDFVASPDGTNPATIS
jgi:hypothetical protein